MTTDDYEQEHMFTLTMRRVGVRGLRVILGLSIRYWRIHCQFEEIARKESAGDMG